MPPANWPRVWRRRPSRAAARASRRASDRIRRPVDAESVASHGTRLSRVCDGPSVEYPADILHHTELDQRMVRAVRAIKLLGMVSWPIEVQHAFLAQWARGDADRKS